MSMPGQSTPRVDTCRGKKLFVSRREAKRAAKLMTRAYREAFHEYPCGTHWHVGHVNKGTGLRRRVTAPGGKALHIGGNVFLWCAPCQKFTAKLDTRGGYTTCEECGAEEIQWT